MHTICSGTHIKHWHVFILFLYFCTYCFLPSVASYSLYHGGLYQGLLKAVNTIDYASTLYGDDDGEAVVSVHHQVMV